jgi:hypothetical protein
MGAIMITEVLRVNPTRLGHSSRGDIEIYQLLQYDTYEILLRHEK